MNRSILVLIAAIAIPSAASAQVPHLNSRERVAYFSAFVDGAQKLAGSGKAGEARVVCLSSIGLIKSQLKVPRWPQRNRAVLEKYDAVCGPLWKGRGGDPVAAYRQYKQSIADYGKALALPPLFRRDRTVGYQVHKRTVDATRIGDRAFAHAVEFVDKLPAPDKTLPKLPANFDFTLNQLIAIVTGRKGAAALADKETYPAIRAKLAEIDGSVKPKHNAGQLSRIADDLDKWVELLRAGKASDPAVGKYTRRVAAIRAEARRKWAAYVAKQRMPRSAYRGRDKAKLIATLRATYAHRYPKEKVMRVVIASDDWGPARGEGWWDGKVWKWSVFSRLPNVGIAVKTSGGDVSHRVFSVTFARERKGTGWTAPYVLKTGYGRPILAENIGK